MPPQAAVRALHQAADLLLPGPLEGVRLSLGNRGVDHRVEQLVLAAEVAVQRHGADAEVVGEAAHAERLEPVAVEQLERGGGDLLRGEPCAGCCLRRGHAGIPRRTVYGTVYG